MLAAAYRSGRALRSEPACSSAARRCSHNRRFERRSNCCVAVWFGVEVTTKIGVSVGPGVSVAVDVAVGDGVSDGATVNVGSGV